MPDCTLHRITRHLWLGALPLIVAVTAALSAAALATSRRSLPSGGAVVVEGVPADACVAFYGPGLCREHGSTVVGSTDAVALWPPPHEGRPATPTAQGSH